MVAANGKRRWLGILLVLSLGLNLFFASMMVGRWFGHGPGGPGGGPGMRMLEQMERAGDDLPEADRAAFRARLDALRPAMEQGVQKMRGARDRLREVLSAPTLDEAAFTAAQDEMQRSVDTMQENMRALVLEAARALPPERRRELFDRRR